VACLFRDYVTAILYHGILEAAARWLVPIPLANVMDFDEADFA
jgi:hypothetical protein